MIWLRIMCSILGEEHDKEVSGEVDDSSSVTVRSVSSGWVELSASSLLQTKRSERSCSLLMLVGDGRRLGSAVHERCSRLGHP